MDPPALASADMPDLSGAILLLEEVAEPPYKVDRMLTQLHRAGALAGIGFTMSLFIAGQAFPAPGDFAAAKIAVFTASVLSALIGVAVLWQAPDQETAGGE